MDEDLASRTLGWDDILHEEVAVSDPAEISYLALPPGTAVQTSSGATFGTVEHVLQVPDLDLFDGLVVATNDGLRFVDRDQIRQITARAVKCTLTDSEAANLPAPSGPPVYSVDAFADEGPRLSAVLGRLFNRGHWLKED